VQKSYIFIGVGFLLIPKDKFLQNNFFALMLIAGIVVFVTGMSGSPITFGLMGIGAAGLAFSAFASPSKRRT